MKIENIDTGFKDIFIPFKSNAKKAQSETSSVDGDPQIPDDTVPLDQFQPRTDQPLKVKYSQDEEGNSMTEVEDESSR